MPYRLPPLHTLRLFEAAGRLKSFKMAAAELLVTPSAVSHGVQALEDWLGVELFTRGNRSLELSIAGAAYLTEVQAVLDRLAEASTALPGQRPNGRLTISAAPSFALLWLMPHLPRFQALHPGIEIAVDTQHQHVAFPRDGVDLAIRMGRGDWPGLAAHHLIQEQLVPVCTPPLAARLKTPADLAGHTLLRVADVSEDWESWAALAGVSLPSTSRSLSFDTIHMAMSAAAQGLGVAIGRLPLITADLAAGRLVPVFGPPRGCDTGYWLVALPPALQRPEAKAFRRWIVSELGYPAKVSPLTPTLSPFHGARGKRGRAYSSLAPRAGRGLG